MGADGGLTMAEQEYIEREAALKVLCDACGNAACPKGLISRCSYYEKMQSIPAADVRPVVRGKWEYEEKELKSGVVACFHTCSVCGYHTNLFVIESISSKPYYYCPNCGADMREES